MLKVNLSATRIIICLLGLCMLPRAYAEQKPLWEAGIGVGAINLPDYRGSDESHTYALPIPYFVYRGEHLKADRNGVRGILYESDKVDLNLSVNGTVPVHSEDNAARKGMTNLKPTIEVGPTANIALWQTLDKKTKLEFRTPIRATMTVESSPKYIGWVFTPAVNLDVKDPLELRGWNFGLSTGLVINDRRYNQYFYSVSSADATVTRPAYEAPGGYSGAQFTLAASKRFPQFWLGSFVRYDTLGHAVFRDSPLVKKQYAVTGGIAIAWIISQSGQIVTSDD
jgi:outer membrane protein